ncbi:MULTISPECIES: L-tyrosine 3-hydroxylase [unclassified Streptomyces]|uniref:L-tyrosine 3-hydroxylase n=1 Tax=unclassified Streptomyces TaxID=2593676 RepID=UPI00382A1984
MTTTLVEQADQDSGFGTYPYALESIVLPYPGTRTRGRAEHIRVPHADVLRETAFSRPLPPPATPEELYWFRWITGHQAVFALWQLIDDELELVVNDGVESAAARATSLIHAYSVLLVYTGSPTRELYERLIRPAMMLQHRSFSGRWARDYAAIPPRLRSLRARYRQTEAPDAIAELNRAGRLNHQVHMAIAAKLIPDGDSLLRAGDGAAALGAPTEDTSRLYDSFFATHRALRTRREVIAQLARRLRVILLDLHSNGLYPTASSSAAECPAELRDGDLTCFTNGAVPLLVEAGRTLDALRH